jgi:hypothetical protein
VLEFPRGHRLAPGQPIALPLGLPRFTEINSYSDFHLPRLSADSSKGIRNRQLASRANPVRDAPAPFGVAATLLSDSPLNETGLVACSHISRRRQRHGAARRLGQRRCARGPTGLGLPLRGGGAARAAALPAAPSPPRSWSPCSPCSRWRRPRGRSVRGCCGYMQGKKWATEPTALNGRFFRRLEASRYARRLFQRG